MSRIVVYPAAIAAAWVLTAYIAPIPPLYVLVRPVVVAVGVVVALQLLFSAWSRNRHVGALAGTALPLLLVEFWIGALIVFSAVLPMLVRSVRQRRLATVDWPAVTRFLTPISVIALMVTVVLGAGRGITPVGQPAPPPAATDPNLPDLYLIMLDGYPRADTLARDFDFDNEPFLQAMEAQGFEVAREAHSNYNITWLTLASMFNTEHLATLMPQSGTASIDEQLGTLNRLINEGSTLQAARQAGYEILAISGGSVSSSLTSADRFIDTGQVNSFEAPLLRKGVLPYLLPDLQADVLHGQLRYRFNESVAALRDVASESHDRPRLVWAHLMAPHPPVIFDAQGGPSTDPGCYPLGCGLFDQVYDATEPRFLQEQLQYVNGEVLEVTREILAADRRAVLVVFSDHGFRHDFDDLDEMVHSLFMSHTADRTNLFPQDAAPINLVATLLNAYAGTQLPLAADESWLADFRKFEQQKSYFPLVRVEP